MHHTKYFPKITAKVIVFDLDGTLIDSAPMVRGVWSAWAEARGLDPTFVLNASKGRRTIDFLYSLLKTEAAVKREFGVLDRMEQDGSDAIPAMAGAIELLSLLPQERWGIATSSSRKSAEIRLAACGIPTPKVFLTGDEVVKGKPDPECYLKAAARFGIRPLDMLVFEDSETGIAASSAAGSLTVRIGRENQADPGQELFWIKDFTKVNVDLVDAELRISVEAI